MAREGRGEARTGYVFRRRVGDASTGAIDMGGGRSRKDEGSGEKRRVRMHELSTNTRILRPNSG